MIFITFRCLKDILIYPKIYHKTSTFYKYVPPRYVESSQYTYRIIVFGYIKKVILKPDKIIEVLKRKKI